MKLKLNKLACVAALLGALGFGSSAMAAGTAAGVQISNTANLSFSIGAVPQTAITSNTVSFLVDNKINLILVEDQGAPVNVTPGSTGNVYKFKLTNLGNSTQDFSFSTSPRPAGTVLFGATDNFDVTGCVVRVDATTGVIGTYEPAVDTLSYADELAPDAVREVYLVCPIAATQVNNDASVVTLLAQAASGGAANTQGSSLTNSGANTAGVDIVFADGAGTDDAVRDAGYTARGVYLVKAATLTFVKTNVPICDPANFNSNPKNIPGAYVRYKITITNAAGSGSSAILGSITDTLNTTGLDFDANLIAPTATSCATTTPPESATGASFKYTCVGGTRACTTTPVYKTGANDADGSQFVTPTITASFTAALPVEAGYAAGELKSGESVSLEFNAIVK